MYIVIMGIFNIQGAVDSMSCSMRLTPTVAACTAGAAGTSRAAGAAGAAGTSRAAGAAGAAGIVLATGSLTRSVIEFSDDELQG